MISRDRYGPWAVIIEGSEGMGWVTGAQIGAAGINLALIARGPAALSAVCTESGVEVRSLELAAKPAVC